MRKYLLAISQVPCNLPEITLLKYFDPSVCVVCFLDDLPILKHFDHFGQPGKHV